MSRADQVQLRKRGTVPPVTVTEAIRSVKASIRETQSVSKHYMANNVETGFKDLTQITIEHLKKNGPRKFDPDNVPGFTKNGHYVEGLGDVIKKVDNVPPLNYAKNSQGWYVLVPLLVALLVTLSLTCRADTALVTNTISFPVTNEHMFYRLVKVPPVPLTNEVSGKQSLQPSALMPVTSLLFVTSSMVATNVPLVVAVDQIATMVLTTNWTDLPPSNTLPVTTTLADSGQGLEYGTLVTNKVIQVLEDGDLHPLVVRSYTNTTEVLTRSYQFKRVHDPGSVRRHVKATVGVR